MLSAALVCGVGHADLGSMDLATWAASAKKPTAMGSYNNMLTSNNHQVASSSFNPYAGATNVSYTSNAMTGVSASASTGPRERYPVGKPTLKCVIEAANRQNVPVDLLLAVNSVERGNTGQFVNNTNGTKDIGAFQINTIHLPRAMKYQATAQDLATRGCYNAEFAALLLREAITHPRMQNKDYFTRAAGYHSWTPKHNAVYRKKLVGYLSQWQSWLRAQNMQDLIKAPPAR